MTLNGGKSVVIDKHTSIFVAFEKFIVSTFHFLITKLKNYSYQIALAAFNSVKPKIMI